ncbi:3-hydroxybutyryl-CoA dehydrogenase [Massilia sp. WF1]|uniref:3-hydroxyacyl-CoA dehydrogenase family protein n=1 Tax=unclassified Massilia TaxID=2609279 RepID=UPI00064B68AB|nr:MULTISPECIES: 3-hydroxyacyl-CoA dehydrogenase family protein [unclassified Massilia]ALK95506.1 3-hydroxybutyryl-CoA dehydrogenase [Massilia sp. WG5]KLU34917.1 3-hydroxybutyryl-CoA dehydrogenase [Massilia sp. WF1]
MTDIHVIGVVGGGLMGVGIATQFALAGHATLVVEADPERAAGIPVRAADILSQLMAAGLVDAPQRDAALARLRVSGGLDELAGAAMAIEAIPEVLGAKHTLYAQLEDIMAPDAIIASNTSGFPPDALSEHMRKPARFLVAHFWNPPHLIPLVEVVPGSATAPDAVERSVRLLAGIGMEPVVLKAAIPGFIGNRLQFAVLREALHIVRSGAATPETVDAVMKACLGRRYSIMGPFESADLGGLHTLMGIGANLMPALAKDEEVLELMRAHVDKGELGASTGQGFYTWDEDRIADLKARRLRQLSGK